ncbi:carboxypeptidase-like regulatory domain-containing protein [Adhaeribacter terrigena]|uniref:carboxypeptidase-like regulatory domain-containing protein n=1 Tax=Adhaeribacter terrigena TaxID=2793070 RepID=UPI001F3E473A|nr:carboxypeptidase-like regulatory domain-containing protein [Adhaeribacter terrigena]
MPGASMQVNYAADVLTVTFMGYAQQEITVGNRDFINVELAPNTRQLNEVVVTVRQAVTAFTK